MSPKHPAPYLVDEKDNYLEDVKHVEHNDVERMSDQPPYAVQEVDMDEGFDAQALKKTLRKVDWRVSCIALNKTLTPIQVLPVLMAMYTVSQMDRGNLSLARAANNKAMSKDLGLTIGQRYSVITLAFFPPYIAIEIPVSTPVEDGKLSSGFANMQSQLGLRRFGARLWLGGATLLWGVIMLAMAFIKNWQSLAGLRALLGAFEGVLFPGATYLIGCWYPRNAIALRMAIFYQVPYAIAGCSALISWGISHMHGIAGMHGWE